MSSNQEPIMKEFVFHGRGGQGAWTASEILAKAALVEKLQIQSFPMFGPERQGAPLEAFTRISNYPIRLHCNIYSPDFVVVLDPTLLTERRTGEIYKTIKPDGSVIINSRTKVDRTNTYTVDAGKIAEDKLGRSEMVNIAILGGLQKVIDLKYDFPKISFASYEEAVGQKFEEREKLVVNNMAAFKEVYDLIKV